MELTVTLRRRSEIFIGSGDWSELTVGRSFRPDQAALIICDLWDQHWSRGASSRVAALAPRVNLLATHLRNRGAMIVHAPSETIDFYRDHPSRRRIADQPRLTPPPGPALADPPLPIDDSDGGSDTGERVSRRVWTRQHPDLEIAESDAVSDDGDEIYSLFRQAGIHTVLITGVHTNLCVLNRPFAIKSLVRWGFHTILVRDLTDAMYNPARPPYVSHDRGTELVVEHIEKHWCPTTLSTEILG